MKITPKITNLIWDMACSAIDNNCGPFMTKEYDKLSMLGWHFFNYKRPGEMITDHSKEEQIMFTFMIYYSLTIPE